MLPRRKLPIGIQTFAKIREDNYYYVDKTGIIEPLLRQGGYYFLSRQRRFGKSLLLDTFKELFEGNEPLFRGLHIHDRWDWSTRYPVIRISFGGGVLKSKTDLGELLNQQFNEHEARFGLSAHYTDARSRLRALIAGAHHASQFPVVVLIDEYDKPILDNITEPEVAATLRESLKDLYSVLKDMDACLRFVFLTGVSKFSKVSLFSGLNNLFDLTLDRRFSSICGYTDQDVDTTFAPELEGLDRDEIRRWYNGYHWLGDSVYNPFDALLLFDTREFRPWWFETGTTTFLVKLLAQKNTYTPSLESVLSSPEILSSFDIERILPEVLMFQAGYLTIHKAEERGRGNWRYTLGFPNLEVKTSINASLMGEYTDDQSRSFALRQYLWDALYDNDFMDLERHLQSLFASIPYHWFVKNPISQYEGYYASVFYSHFAALGLDIVLEDSSNRGRVDMTIHFNHQYYLFEFKVVEQVPDGSALAQLKAKRYADKYRASGQPIHLIGVEFSSATRSLVRFEVEQV